MESHPQLLIKVAAGGSTTTTNIMIRPVLLVIVLLAVKTETTANHHLVLPIMRRLGEIETARLHCRQNLSQGHRHLP
jgi:hypothetical protein